MSDILRIATRKSPLALWQAEFVKTQLLQYHSHLKVEMVTMTTQGDKVIDTPLAKVGGKGLFVKELELNGVGYKAAEKGKSIELNLGYSHPINFPVPEGLKIEVPKPTQIKISGIDKQKVGQIASEIRSFRKPEPFKGKGIKYKEEIIRRKEGKKK